MKDSYSIYTICNFCGGLVRVALSASEHAVFYRCDGCGKIWRNAIDVINRRPINLPKTELPRLEPLSDGNIGYATRAVCRDKNNYVCFNNILQSDIRVYKYKADGKLYIIDDDFCDIYRPEDGCDLWRSPRLYHAGDVETALGLDKSIYKRFFEYFDEPDAEDYYAANITPIFNRITNCRRCMRPYDRVAELAFTSWVTAKKDLQTGALFCRCDFCGATWEDAADALLGLEPTNLLHGNWSDAGRDELRRAGWLIYKSILHLPGLRLNYDRETVLRFATDPKLAEHRQYEWRGARLRPYIGSPGSKIWYDNHCYFCFRELDEPPDGGASAYRTADGLYSVCGACAAEQSGVFGFEFIIN